MAAPTTVLTVIKRFPYRGVNEDWSNTYMLSGSTPADTTAWKALFDALVLQEKTLYTGSVSVVKGYGYNKVPGPGDSAVWSVDMTVAPNSPVVGTLSASSRPMSGDQAAWVRWGLDRFNSKGKRIYLRKYFHGGCMAPAGTADALDAGFIAALSAFGTKLRDGTFTGSRVITDKLGTAVIGSGASSYTTTRTLKRRGKRPPTP